jgi:hypothetical protein
MVVSISASTPLTILTSNPGNLVSHIQVFSPYKPVSIFFDAFAAID